MYLKVYGREGFRRKGLYIYKRECMEEKGGCMGGMKGKGWVRLKNEKKKEEKNIRKKLKINEKK